MFAQFKVLTLDCVRATLLTGKGRCLKITQDYFIFETKNPGEIESVVRHVNNGMDESNFVQGLELLYCAIAWDGFSTFVGSEWKHVPTRTVSEGTLMDVIQ